MTIKIDICSDLGEGYGRYELANDEALMEIISSANIACGFHAGDPRTIQKSVQSALKTGTGIGAHPGFPDRVGFGRRDMTLSYEEVYTDVLYQIGAVYAFAEANGAKLQHVMAHGQLQNMAQFNEVYAEAITDAVYNFDPNTILICLPGKLLKMAENKGLKAATVIFADRRYNDDTSLVSRREKNAVITDENEVIEKVLDLVIRKKATSINGKELEIVGDTLLLHGDTQGSLSLAKKIKEALLDAGVEISPLGKWL
ncbi:5-oxoprolinase subunit PxpA [Robertmurraya massiliosenegalensis]|uniref:LamB/YcsF family protein n=1 Tax=Robertmurraya TaxID=2837507 RepID=UPI0039A536AE